MNFVTLFKLICLLTLQCTIACKAGHGNHRPSWHHNYDLLRMMDSTVDPCTDFYKYTCGNYLNYTVLKDYEDFKAVHVDVGDELISRVGIILNTSESSGDSPSALLAKRNYQACMDEEAAEGKGWEPVKDFIRQFGGWPAVGDATWQNQHWWMTEVEISKLTESGALIRFTVEESMMAPGPYFLTLRAPVLPLEPQHYSNSATAAYIHFIKTTIVALGGKVSEAYQTALEIFEFGKKLANITSGSTILPFDVHSFPMPPTTIGELKQQYAQLHMNIFFDYLDEHGWEVGDERLIYIEDIPHMFGLTAIPYLQSVSNLISETDTKTVVNYQIWTAIYRILHYLPKKLIPELESINKVLPRTKGWVPNRNPVQTRWISCYEQTKERFPEIIMALYANAISANAIRREAERIVVEVLAMMDENLRAQDWMDNSTLETALRKLHNIKAFIGYPDYYHNETKLLTPFQDLSLSNNNRFDNGVKWMEQRFMHSCQRLTTIRDQKDWSYFGQYVNMFYIPWLVTINAPMGFLQYPIFDVNMPGYAKYGVFGATAGHEISHHFDPLGSTYDENGQMRDWWDAYTKSHFQNKTRCFLPQYNVTEEQSGHQINPHNIIHEIVADNGAVRLGHEVHKCLYYIHLTRLKQSGLQLGFAYKRWIKSTPQSEHHRETLGGLSSDQLYFISYAQFHCQVFRNEYIVRVIEKTFHPPWKLAVNGAMKNYENFSTAFNCAAGTPMNPVEKCHLW